MPDQSTQDGRCTAENQSVSISDPYDMSDRFSHVTSTPGFSLHAEIQKVLSNHSARYGRRNAKKKSLTVSNAVLEFDQWSRNTSTRCLLLRIETDEATAAASATLGTIKRGGPCYLLDLLKMTAMSDALNKEESFLVGDKSFPYAELLAAAIAVSNSLRNLTISMERIEEQIAAIKKELAVQPEGLTSWTASELFCGSTLSFSSQIGAELYEKLIDYRLSDTAIGK